MTSKFNFYWFLCFLVCFAILVWLQPRLDHQTRLSQPQYELQKLMPNESGNNGLTFEDITLQAGLTTPHSQKSGEINGLHESLGAGVCSFDFDNDGWLDILLLTGSGNTHYFGHQEWWQNDKNSVQLYRNNGNGTFSNVTQQAGLNTSKITIGCAVGDFDSDGNLDFFLANNGPNEIWRNIGTGRFKRQTNAFQQQDFWSTSAVVTDFNQDGLPDLYVANYLKFKPNSLTFEKSSGFRPEKHPDFDATLHSGSPNRLLINKGNWQFVDLANKNNVANTQGRALAVSSVDLNNDGLLDILVANDINSENKAFTNNGSGFSDESTRLKLATLASTTAISPFTHDGNAHLLQSSGTKDYNRVFESNKETNSALRDTTEKLNFHLYSKTFEMSWPPAVADFNSDGNDDLFTPNGLLTPNQDEKTLTQNQQNTLLLTNSDRYDIRVSKLDDKTMPVASSRCAIAGDFDNNGAIDILIASNNGLPQLLTNQSPPQYWVGLILDFNVTQAEITIDNQTVFYNVKDGTNGFCWQDNRRLIIPFKNDTNTANLTIKTNFGESVVNQKIASNNYYRISQSGLTPVRQFQAAQSKFIFSSFHGKATLIEFLLNSNQLEQAFNEIKLLMNHENLQIPDNILVFKKLSSRLNPLKKIRLAPDLLTSTNPDLQIAGIDLAKQTESDLLARWLLPLIESSNPNVSCEAAEAFEHFFTEEEAMTLSKYASLTILMRRLELNDEASHCAASALGEAERYRAVEPLVAMLTSENPRLELEAIKALGRIREKSAFSALKEKMWGSSTSTEARMAIIGSLMQIDSSFDIASEITDLNNHQQRADKLKMLISATRLNSPIRQSTRQQLRNWTGSKYKNDLNDLSEEELANYTLITKQSKAISKLRGAFLKNAKSSRSTLEALLALDLLNTADYLIKLISSDPGYVPNKGSGFSLKLSDFIKLSRALGNNTSSIQPYLKYLSQQDVDRLYSRSLTQAITSNENFVMRVLLDNQVITRSLKNEDCNIAIQRIVGGKVESPLREMMIKRPDVIEACLSQQKNKLGAEQLLDIAQNYPELSATAINLIQKKSDRASRELILTTIVDSSQNIPLRKLIIETLPEPLTPSRKRVLAKLFDQFDDRVLSIAAANKLTSIEAWMAEKHSIIERRLTDALKEKDELIALELSKILYLYNPSKTFALLENHH